MRYTFLLLTVLLALGAPAQAQSSPQWSTLNPDQQRFLLEAFSMPETQKGTFADGVPNEVKQGLLDSIWNVMTPEKRIQVLLYAHLEKPFSQASNSASTVQAPAWTTLNSLQKVKAYEAFKMDPTQKMLFDAMSPELRQLAFNTLWAYLSPEARRSVMR